MSQGLIAGGTDYSSQTVKDILDDINAWITFSSRLISYNETFSINQHKNKIWQLVPYNFKSTIIHCMEFWKTANSDLLLIKHAIETNQISSREIKLLKRIGDNARELNNNLGKYYNEDYPLWHRFGDADFKTIEKLYCENRDFCATFIDASNAAYRLKDYENPNHTNVYINSNNNNSVNYSVYDSFNGDIKSSQIQIGNDLRAEQDNSSNRDIPYDSILNALVDIKYEVEKCKALNAEILELYNESVDEAKKKENPKNLKQNLEKLKSLASSIGSFIIVNTVKGALSYYSDKYGI